MNDRIKKLQDLFRYAYENPHSSFYRDLYGPGMRAEHIDSESAWRNLPLLTKERIVATPFWERIFTEGRDVDYIRASSGTSGKNLMIMPKTRTQPIPAVQDPRRYHGVVTFLQPPHQYEKDYIHAGFRMPILSGDPTRLRDTIRLMASANITGLHIYPFLLEQAIPYFREFEMMEKLRMIMLVGERIGFPETDRCRELFPNADIILWYGAIESMGVPAYMKVEPDTAHLAYTVGPEYYFELIDERGDAILTDDVEGEIVYTLLWTDDSTFPLLRLQSGDLGKRLTDSDGTERYLFMGRKHIDRIKVPHGEIRVEEVEAVLETLLGRQATYELHFRKRDPSGLPRMTLVIEATGGEWSATDVAASFSRMLRIAPEMRYEALIKQGLHAPVLCEMIGAFPGTFHKRRKLRVFE